MSDESQSQVPDPPGESGLPEVPKPFFFVMPSMPVGKTDAYPGSVVFSASSWEWLCERYVRRTTIPRAVGVRRPSAFLAGRKGAYGVPPLLPLSYSSPRESALETPSAEPLPDGGEIPPSGDGEDDGGLTFESESTSIRAPELAARVMALAVGSVSGHEFRDPDAKVPESLVLDMTTKENVWASGTVADPGSSAFSGHVTDMVTPGRPPLSGLPMFRMLGDMRLDDSFRTFSVKAWNPELKAAVDVSVRMPPVLFPRLPRLPKDLSETLVCEFERMPVAGFADSLEVLRLDGLSNVTSGLGIPVQTATSLPFRKPRTVSGSGDLGSVGISGLAGHPAWIGAVLEPPPAARGGAGLSGGMLHPSPDWDGAPTCWKSWGLPPEEPAPGSPVEARQLEALRYASPTLPPVAPGLGADGSFFSASLDRNDADVARRRRPLLGGGPGSPALTTWQPLAGRRFPVVPACEPDGISRMLDRLGSTVLPLPSGVRLFAYVSRGCRTEVVNRSSDSEGDWSESREVHETDVSGNFVGSFAELLGIAGLSVPWPALDSLDVYRGSISDETGNVVVNSRDGGTERNTSSVSGMTLLVPGAESRSALRKSSRESRFSRSRDSGASVATSAWTDIPDENESFEPATVAELYLHPDVLAWMRSAELLVVLDVAATADIVGRNETRSTSVWTADGSVRYSGSTGGNGTGTHRRRISLVRLGKLDLETGEIPEVDLGSVLRTAIPPSSSYRAFGGSGRRTRDSSTVVTSEYEPDNLGDMHLVSVTTVNEDTTVTAEAHELSLLSARLYLSVDWDFDTKDPPEPRGEDSLALMIVRAVRRYLARVASVLASARSALSRSRLETARDNVAAAMEDIAELDAELDDLIEDLTERLEELEDELAEAQEELDGLKSAKEDAEARRAELQRQIAETDDPPGYLLAELAETNIRIATLSQQIDEAAAKVQALSSRVNAARSALAEARDAKVFLEDCAERVASAASALADVEAESRTARDRLLDAEQAYADAKEALSVAEDALGTPSAVAKARAALAAAKAAKAALDALSGALVSLASAYDRLEAALADAADAIAAAEKTLSRLRGGSV